MKIIVSILILGISLFSSTISVRPHSGIGTDESKHSGLRLLLDTNTKQSYGLDITHFKTKNGKFTSVGIVLEQKLFEWFSMSIGTVGYFDYKEQNIAGLTYGLGYEPNNFPFLIFRGDVIFEQEKTKTIHSISLGYKFKF